MTISTFDPARLDGTVRPQDDLFRHANGEWLRTAVIPEDRPLAGSFTALRDASELAVRAIIEDAALQAGPHRRVVLLGVAATMGSLLFGYDTGVISGALLSFTLSLDNTVLSSFVSVAGSTPWPVYVVASLGILLVGWALMTWPWVARSARE